MQRKLDDEPGFFSSWYGCGFDGGLDVDGGELRFGDGGYAHER
jgi:hypothetical protein